jgi:hypothetical protein
MKRKRFELAAIILVVVIIWAVVGGVWLYKIRQHSHPLSSATQTTNTDTSQIGVTSTSLLTDALAAYPNGSMGFAISYPQCPKSFPNSSYGYGILGVTKGRSFTHNPCLKDEISWARRAQYHPSFYINLSFPQDKYPTLIKSFNCRAGDQKCAAYHFGYAIAQDAYNYAQSQGLADAPWWLDMQTISTWSSSKNTNAQVVQGAADFYKNKHLPVGLSTTPYQWDQIAGDYVTNLPNWVPGRIDQQIAAQYCSSGKSYSGGWVQQVAYVEKNFEVVYACGKK